MRDRPAHAGLAPGPPLSDPVARIRLSRQATPHRRPDIVGNSLQEQLLKAGLVNEQKLKQSRTEKRQEVRKTGKPGPDSATREAREAAERSRRDKAERDRELNRQRQEEAALRAAENELRQLIHSNRVIREGGDLAYNFSDGTKLKRIHVNRELHARLVSGQLAIVRQDDFYEVIPAAIAERVRERDPGLILVFNQPAAAPADEDPYAEYQVPDDLMW